MQKTNLAPLLLASITSFLPVYAANPVRSLPIFFLPNAGQADPSIRYIALTPELRAGFSPDSVVFQIHGTALRVRFAGADKNVRIQGLDPLAARINFLIGDDPAAWHTNLPTYQRIVYRNLYAGIDMTYAGSDPKLKSEFTIAPGANPGQIRLEYPGADRVSLDANGDL